MAPRRHEIPPGVEIVDADGSIVAAGEEAAREPVSAGPGRRLLTLKRVAVALAAAVVGLAVVGFLTRPDGDDHPDPTPPHAIFERSAISIQRDDAGDAVFPLLGLEWDHDLVADHRDGWERIDLNTGEVSTFGRSDESFGSYFSSTVVVDGNLFAEGSNGVYRVSEGGTEPLVGARGPATFGGVAISGHYFLHFGDSGSGDLVANLSHLTTGETVELNGIAGHGAIGDVIFTHHGGVIASQTGNADPTTWAEGEMLGFGPNHLAWRHCDAPETCRYWLGTPDEPRNRPLNEASVTRYLSTQVALRSLPLGGPPIELQVLSPSGRYTLAPREPPRIDPSRPQVSIVDLETGAEVKITGALEYLPAWSPGEEIVAMVQHSRVSVIDMATGEAHRLPAWVQGGNTLTFVPST